MSSRRPRGLADGTCARQSTLGQATSRHMASEGPPFFAVSSTSSSASRLPHPRGGAVHLNT